MASYPIPPSGYFPFSGEEFRYYPDSNCWVPEANCTLPLSRGSPRRGKGYVARKESFSISSCFPVARKEAFPTRPQPQIDRKVRRDAVPDNFSRERTSGTLSLATFLAKGRKGRRPRQLFLRKDARDAVPSNFSCERMSGTPSPATFLAKGRQGRRL